MIDGKSGGKIGMTEVPSDGDDGYTLFSLNPRSYLVDDVTCCFHVNRWRIINSNGNDIGEFKLQMIWTKTDGKKLNVQTTDPFSR